MKLLFALIALVVLAGGAFMVLEPAPTPATVITAVEELGEPAVTIVRTKNGYEPNQVVIKQGDVVLWKNDSDDYHWPASDLHPTHGIYPEFDPLRPLAPQEDWKFKFDKVGEWDFHDHIRANKIGKIYVEDPNAEAFQLEEGQIADEVVE